MNYHFVELQEWDGDFSVQLLCQVEEKKPQFKINSDNGVHVSSTRTVEYKYTPKAVVFEFADLKLSKEKFKIGRVPKYEINLSEFSDLINKRLEPTYDKIDYNPDLVQVKFWQSVVNDSSDAIAKSIYEKFETKFAPLKVGEGLFTQWHAPESLTKEFVLASLKKVEDRLAQTDKTQYSRETYVLEGLVKPDRVVTHFSKYEQFKDTKIDLLRNARDMLELDSVGIGNQDKAIETLRNKSKVFVGLNHRYWHNVNEESSTTRLLPVALMKRR